MRGRWIAAIIASLLLGALLFWQQQRLALVDACHAAGGWWDGNRSRCRQVPPSIIIEKNLKRSGIELPARTLTELRVSSR